MTDGEPSDSLARRRSAEARAALDDLVSALDVCIEQLNDARRHATELCEQHDDGKA